MNDDGPKFFVPFGVPIDLAEVLLVPIACFDPAVVKAHRDRVGVVRILKRDDFTDFVNVVTRGIVLLQRCIRAKQL